MKAEMTASRVRELFTYDPITGTFFVKNPPPRSTRLVGMRVGWPDNRGYVVIKVDGRCYRAHRLAWLYVHGRWPERDIDHRNGISTDNRILNLREATESQNIANGKLSRRNSCGLKGVTFDKRTGKWAAQIQYQGKGRHLGRFNQPELAHQRYMEEATKLFGEFARAQ